MHICNFLYPEEGSIAHRTSVKTQIYIMQFDMFTRFRPCYSYFFFSPCFFFSMSVFPSKEIYHFTTVGQEKLSSYLSVPYNFLPTLRNATVSLDYHPNTEISYLEVVSLPPLKPASPVIVSNSLPCRRRCWSWTELMSWPEIFPQCWKQTARFFLLKTMAFKICFLQHLPH